MPWQAMVIDDMLGVRRDKRWAAREAGLAVPRQNGKSVIAELRILAGLYLLKEELIVYTAHQVDTAMEVFERVVTRIERNADLKRRQPQDRNRGIRRAQGSQSINLLNPPQRLLVKARSKGGVRGFSADTIFLDEAQLGLDEDEMAAIGPTQRTRPNPQTIMMGTPPLEPGTYWALKVRARGLAGDPKMAWHEWGPPDWFDARNPEHLADRAVWWGTNPALWADLMDEEAIEHDHKTLGSKFAADGVGAWPRERSDGWLVIPKSAWHAAHDPTSRLMDPVGFAIATDKDRGWTTISAAGKRPDGLWHAEVIDRRPSVAWAYPRAKELLGGHRNCGLVVVQAGPAGALIPDLEAHKVEVHRASTQDYAKACGMFETGLVGIAAEGQPDPRRFRYRCDAEHLDALDDAVKLAVKDMTGDVWTFERDLDGVDTSPLEAMVLALWMFASFGQTVPPPPMTAKAPVGDNRSMFRPTGRLKL